MKALGNSGLVLGLLALVGCSGVGNDAGASCPGIQVTASPVLVAPGDAVTVEVTGLFAGCNDYGGADEQRALFDVPVLFVQVDRSTELALVDGSDDARAVVQVSVVIPDNAAPGDAAICVGGNACPARLTVTGLDAGPTLSTTPFCGSQPT